MLPKHLASGDCSAACNGQPTPRRSDHNRLAAGFAAYRDLQRRRDEYGNNDTTLDRHERPPLVSATFGPKTTDGSSLGGSCGSLSDDSKSKTSATVWRRLRGPPGFPSVAQVLPKMRASCARGARACATARATPAAPRRCHARRERAARSALARRLLKGTSGTRTQRPAAPALGGGSGAAGVSGRTSRLDRRGPDVLTLLSSKMEE